MADAPIWDSGISMDDVPIWEVALVWLMYLFGKWHKYG